MDSFTFGDIRLEKANAASRYRRFFAITTLLRLVELFVFVIVVSRFTTQFALPFKVSGEYFRGITVTLISPRFVFLLGNAIVIVLFLKSGRFSAKNGEGKITDNFYEEYVEKCRRIDNHQRKSSSGKTEKIKADVAYGCAAERRIIRCRSENVGRSWRQEDERRRELRRSATEVQSKSKSKSTDCRRRPAATDQRNTYSEDEMNGEEFRRTVEAFIARQQRFLREE